MPRLPHDPPLPPGLPDDACERDLQRIRARIRFYKTLHACLITVAAAGAFFLLILFLCRPDSHP